MTGARPPLWSVVAAVALTAACGASDGAFDALPSYEVDLRRAWKADVDHAGTSSPRLADLNGDGVLDVIVGAGKEQRTGTVTALNGRTGRVLWQREYFDEIYATALLAKIDDDDVVDVIVGRRKRAGGLDAVSGVDGALIWDVHSANPDVEVPDMHFNSPVACPDRDGDGRDDLIVIQGGGWDEVRPTSVLHVISSATGRILRTLEMPDGGESYFIPNIEEREDGWRVILGTGGETLPGHLFCLTFPDFEEEWRFPSVEKGFVAGARLHDFDGEGRRDVVVSSFDGTLSRLDGETGAEVWRVEHPGYETYVSPGIGRFDEDEVLDVVAVFSKGAWPQYVDHATLLWVSGRTGEVLERRKFGVMASASPLIVDFDGNGYDEVILATNLSFSPKLKAVENELSVFDGGRAKLSVLSRQLQGFNASTPWLGDLDGNGRLDLVHVFQGSVVRFDVAHPAGAERRIRWHQYRGAGADGVTPRERALAR